MPCGLIVARTQFVSFFVITVCCQCEQCLDTVKNKSVVIMHWLHSDSVLPQSAHIVDSVFTLLLQRKLKPQCVILLWCEFGVILSVTIVWNVVNIIKRVQNPVSDFD